MTTHTLVQAFPFNKLFSRLTARLAPRAAIKLLRINWRMFLLLGFCLSLLFSVFYVFQINEIMRGSYLMKNYQKTVDNLIRENKNLEINLAQISYLENIEKKTKELNFESIGTVKYIQILDSSLAKK